MDSKRSGNSTITMSPHDLINAFPLAFILGVVAFLVVATAFCCCTGSGPKRNTKNADTLERELTPERMEKKPSASKAKESKASKKKNKNKKGKKEPTEDELEQSMNAITKQAKSDEEEGEDKPEEVKEGSKKSKKEAKKEAKKESKNEQIEEEVVVESTQPTQSQSKKRKKNKNKKSKVEESKDEKEGTQKKGDKSEVKDEKADEGDNVASIIDQSEIDDGWEVVKSKEKKDHPNKMKYD